MNLLLTGASGFVGKNIKPILANHFNITTLGLSKSNYIQQVVVHILNSPIPIGIVSLGEEELNYSEDSMDSQKLEDLYKECCFIIKELEREKFYPIPKKFIFTPPFTEESGFLTPTKKTKPLTVITHYEKFLDQLYSFSHDNVE